MGYEGVLQKQNHDDSWNPNEWQQRYFRLQGPILSYTELWDPDPLRKAEGGAEGGPSS